jgi:hypothetical protein
MQRHRRDRTVSGHPDMRESSYHSRLPDSPVPDARVRLSTLAFLALSALLVSMIAFGDRSHLLDQANYLQYFRETDLDWFTHLWLDSRTLGVFAVRMVTEELGWRLWVITLNTLGFAPATGVRITVVTLNLLMIWALSKTRWPLLSLAIWAVIPTGLAAVGLFQIRQGFALAIAMYFALVRQKPILGALLASVVHTTFAFPALFVIVARLFARRSYAVSVIAASASAVGIAVASSVLFNVFGGRRLEEYSQHENFTYFNVVALMVYLIVPTLVLWNRDRQADGTPRADVIRELATMHLSVLVFLIVSFFVYPFGMARIDYYATLLIAFMLPEIRLKNALVLWIIALVLLVIGYDVVKYSLTGHYTYFL